ncbi:MAG: T9SS type A sorting domain-containing protein [Flavobacteriales bacterium]|nr:T9SS type A sorting domain-containing protein [Flavobacteriales bacterium]
MTRQLLALLIVASPMAATAVLTVTIQHTDAVCTYATGSAFAIASGGAPPYTYQWSNGATGTGILDVPAGTYSVTVVDALAEEVMESVTILAQPYQLQGGGGYAFCTGPTNILDDPLFDGVPHAPWYVDGLPAMLLPDASNRYVFTTGGSSGEVYTVSDGDGCAGTITTFGVSYAGNWPPLSIADVEPACDLVADGAITVHSTGPPPAFSTWIHLIRSDGVDQFQAQQPDLDGNVLFTGLEPGYYGVHWWLGHTGEAADPGLCTYDTLWVNVPDLSPFCGSVSGTSWFDMDGDCVHGPNEVGVPYSTLLIEPGGEIAITDGNGHFLFGVADGSYSLEQTDPTLAPICPAVQPVPFTVSGDQQTIDLANGSTVPLDLSVDLASGVFRPGFQTSYAVYARNLSPQISGPLELTVQLDPTLTFLAASVAPTSVAGQTLIWDLSALESFAMQTLLIDVQVPVGTPLGLALYTTAGLSNPLTESTLLNNTADEQNIVVGSYDPNDKRAVTSSRASEDLYYIDQDEWIDYTIRFQNTGTFPAEFVVITDTISHELDMLSFEQGAASHPFSVSFKPGRVIEWRFDDIQLPDSASNEPGSHGLVKFRIRPKLPLLAGTVIENTANIFFDFNPPVITEPSALVAEFSTGVSGVPETAAALSVYPNPAKDAVTVRVDSNALQRLVLTALDGRVVAEIQCIGTSASFDIGGLAAGSYTLVVHTTEGRTIRTSLLKQ